MRLTLPRGLLSARRETRAAARAAFTLMEMLVVVAILVVLAGAGGVIYMRYLEDARRDTAKALDVCRQILVLRPDDALARQLLADLAPRPPQPAPAPGPKAKPGTPR